MDSDVEVKLEIKNENNTDIIVTNQYSVPITLDGSPSVFEIKDEDEHEDVETNLDNQPSCIVSNNVLSDATSTTSLGIVDSYSLALARPKRAQIPKKFHDQLYDISPKKIRLTKRYNESIKEPDQLQPNPYCEVEIVSLSRNYVQHIEPRIKQTPEKLNLSVKALSRWDNKPTYESTPKKTRFCELLPSESEISSDLTESPETEQSSPLPISVSPYKRRIPNDYYRAKFSIKPSYVAVHNIVSVLHADPKTFLYVNFGGCKTCKKLFKKGNGKIPKVANKSKSILKKKYMDITLKSIQSSNVLVTVNENGSIYKFIIKESLVLQVVRKFNRILKAKMVYNPGCKEAVKYTLPYDVKWRECIPTSSMISPANQNNVKQTLIVSEIPDERNAKATHVKESQGLLKLFMNSSKTNSAESITNDVVVLPSSSNNEMIFKANKLRCCIHCSQVFRNEKTHECPGQVALVPNSSVNKNIQTCDTLSMKSPVINVEKKVVQEATKVLKEATKVLKETSKGVQAATKKCVQEASKSVQAATKKIVQETKKKSKNISVSKCLKCNLIMTPSYPHICKMKVTPEKLNSFCQICQLVYTGDHVCKNSIKTKRVLDPTTALYCAPKDAVPEISNAKQNTLYSKGHALDELYCCLLCARSYKFEMSIKRHKCNPLSNISCKGCLQPLPIDEKHACPGNFKCQKCLVIVLPKDYSCHLCKILKYCTYCDTLLKGNSKLDCTITECRTLMKCKVCDANLSGVPNHQCKNLVKCQKCNILYGHKFEHKCDDANPVINANLSTGLSKTNKTVPICRVCSGKKPYNVDHVCREQCQKCRTYIDDVNLHKCLIYSTCKTCHIMYDENTVHVCNEKIRCQKCKLFISSSDSHRHKCFVTCIFCKVSIPFNEKDGHKCASILRCSICQMPTVNELNHKCKKCTYCKDILTKRHKCNVKNQSNKTVLDLDVITEDQKALKILGDEKPEIISKHIYTCATCKMTTKLKTEYLKHSCVKKVDSVFLCNGCPKMFSKREFLEKHQTTKCPNTLNKLSDKRLKFIATEEMAKTQKSNNDDKSYQNDSNLETEVKQPESVSNLTSEERITENQNFLTQEKLTANFHNLTSQVSFPESVQNFSEEVLSHTITENILYEVGLPEEVINFASSEFIEGISNCPETESLNAENGESSNALSLPCLIDDSLQFDDAIVEIAAGNPLTWEEISSQLS